MNIQSEPTIEEKALAHEDMIALIYGNLSDSIRTLNAQIDAIKAQDPQQLPQAPLSNLVTDVRKLVVFLKYSSQYLRQSATELTAREEILRIKLHLLSILRALSDQIRLGDNLAVHDLITEELRDNLTLWKINVLPLLRPRPAQAIGLTNP
ncbi:MAG: hypothetical protein ACLGG7_00200 [Bacteriovoracia bacterium]